MANCEVQNLIYAIYGGILAMSATARTHKNKPDTPVGSYKAKDIGRIHGQHGVSPKICHPYSQAWLQAPFEQTQGMEGDLSWRSGRSAKADWGNLWANLLKATTPYRPEGIKVLLSLE